MTFRYCAAELINFYYLSRRSHIFHFSILFPLSDLNQLLVAVHKSTLVIFTNIVLYYGRIIPIFRFSNASNPNCFRHKSPRIKSNTTTLTNAKCVSAPKTLSRCNRTFPPRQPMVQPHRSSSSSSSSSGARRAASPHFRKLNVDLIKTYKHINEVSVCESRPAPGDCSLFTCLSSNILECTVVLTRVILLLFTRVLQFARCGKMVVQVLFCCCC